MLNAYDILRAENEAFRDPNEPNIGGPSQGRDERNIAARAFAIFLLNILKKGQSRSKILFTTRLMPTEFETDHGHPKERIEKFELNGLDANGAQDYWKACGLDYLDPDLPKFVEDIGGHPLALSIMAAVMSASKMATIAEFRVFDPEFGPEEVLADRRPTLTPGGPSRRKDVFQAALRRLTEPQRMLLVRIASYRQPAPLDELEKMFLSRSDNTSFVNRDELTNALDTLQNLRLIGYQKRERSYDMHPVVRGVVRLRTSRNDWYEATERVVESLVSKPPRFDVRTRKDISDEVLIFRCKIDLGRYQEAALRYAGNSPGDLRPALAKLGEDELEADLLGAFFKISLTGHTRRFEFVWDGDESTGLTAKSDFAQKLAFARNAKGAWEEALEFHALHKSCGLCQDPMCDTGIIDTLRALGRLAQAERTFAQCRIGLRKFTPDRFRNTPGRDLYRRSDNYDRRLNYASYRLAIDHFDRAIRRKSVHAARLSFVRSQTICSQRPVGQNYWFENGRELLRSRNLDLAALARIEKKPDAALLISREVRKMAEDDGHLADSANALLSMARSHFDYDERRGYSEAEKCVRGYLEIRSRDLQSRTTSSAWRLLVQILIKAKRLDEAERLLVEIEGRAAAWSDVCEEAMAGALRAKLCNARGQAQEAMEPWFGVLDKLTIESGTPSDDPMIVEAIGELKKGGVLSQSRQRALALGPPARDGWLTINPFDRYWTPWFGVGVPLSPNWQLTPGRSKR